MDRHATSVYSRSVVRTHGKRVVIFINVISRIIIIIINIVVVAVVVVGSSSSSSSSS